jgi:hypothetical protein
MDDGAAMADIDAMTWSGQCAASAAGGLLARRDFIDRDAGRGAVGVSRRLSSQQQFESDPYQRSSADWNRNEKQPEPQMLPESVKRNGRLQLQRDKAYCYPGADHEKQQTEH